MGCLSTVFWSTAKFCYVLFCRHFFLSECFFFLSSRACTADLDGLVALRFFFLINVCLSKCSSLWITPSLFCNCDRFSWDARINVPSDVKRVANFSKRNSFSSGVSSDESFTFHRSVTFEFTLFTFCPPGPLLREVENSSSLLRRGEFKSLVNGIGTQSKMNLCEIKNALDRKSVV